MTFRPEETRSSLSVFRKLLMATPMTHKPRSLTAANISAPSAHIEVRILRRLVEVWLYRAIEKTPRTAEESMDSVRNVPRGTVLAVGPPYSCGISQFCSLHPPTRCRFPIQKTCSSRPIARKLYAQFCPN